MSGMPRLGAAFLTARLAQAAVAGGLFQPIAGWWFARVATVLRKLVFQGLDPGSLDGNDLQQAANQRNHCIFALASNSPNFFFGGQVERLHNLILAEMCDFDNGKVQQTIMSE